MIYSPQFLKTPPPSEAHMQKLPLVVAVLDLDDTDPENRNY
jgi:hypothetical protein